MTLPITVDPTAKFQIPQTFLGPNLCVGCQRTCSDQKFAVDLKKFIKFYGNLYLCYDCVTSLASIFNFITPEKFEEISNKLASKDLEYVQLEKENFNLKQVIDGYRNLGSLASGDFGNTFSGPVLEAPINSNDVEQSSPEKNSEAEIIEVGEETAEERTDGDKLSEGVDSTVNDGEPLPTELSNIEGPSDVRSDSSSATDEYRDLF